MGVGCAAFSAQEQSTIGLSDEPSQPQLIAFEDRITGDGHLTASIEMAVQRTLGADSQRSLRIVHALQQLMQLGVAGPAFDPDRALPACGQAIFDADASADALAETQPDQAGRREDDRVVLACIKLGQTGVHIATQKLNLEVGATRQQLRLAPQAGRTYDRAGGQRIEILVVIGDERIARILPLTDAIQAEPCLLYTSPSPRDS